MNKLSKYCNIFCVLTWVFCVLQAIARFYSFFVANIFVVLELICFSVVLILFIVGLVKLKRQEKKLKESIREYFLKILMIDTENKEGENNDTKE